MITPRGNTTLIFTLVIIEDLKLLKAVPPGTLESADDVEQESGQHDPQAPRISKFANPYYVERVQEVKYYAFGNQEGSK
jgi:hypothetical protein